MQYKEIDIAKLIIILIVGCAAILSIYLEMSDIPALCLGGLIGYLSKDLQLKPPEEGFNQ